MVLSVSFSLYYFFIFVCLCVNMHIIWCVCVHECVCVYVCASVCLCRSDDNLCIQVSPSTMWILGMKLRLHGKSPYLLCHLTSPCICFWIEENTECNNFCLFFLLQLPFASYLLEAILKKINENKKLTEGYFTVMKDFR